MHKASSDMQKISTHTKSKIIAGYITVFVFSIAAIFFIYKQILRLTIEETGISTANQKLFIIGKTITGLYEAESLSNAFIQTGSGQAFKQYMSAIEKVENNIDSLKSLTTHPEQQLKLDSVNTLLKEKIKNLNALIRAKRSLKADDFYNQVITSLESEKDSSTIQRDIHQRIITTIDSSYVRTGKKRSNFWNWLTGSNPDSTLQVTVSHHTITDTLQTKTPIQNTDTILSILKSAWQDIQEKKKNVNREISRTEYIIIVQSTNITNQLRRILNEYENEEINNSFSRIEQREKVVNSTTRIIAGVAIAASVLILLFSFYILRDISRSQRYRRKLEAANQYADELLKSREKLILTVTHDIKSPLGSIIGYTELLENTPVTQRQGYFLKNMKSSSQHILRLVTNLLDYSKLESNKMPVEEVIFNPSLLFREICDSFVPMAGSKNLELNCKIGEDLNSDCMGDALRIRQVLANILSNAVKYTTKGSVSFTATTTTTDDKIIIRIKDSGPGMTKEEQEMIFTEFTRLSSSRATEGTGLGLTITLKLVELLNGEISLESEPGQGSCFTLRFPLKRVGSTDTTTPTEIKNTEDQRTENPANLRILLIDDDTLQLEMTSALLENKGIKADTTTHPEQVAEWLQTHSYDLIFSDIQMPGTDGFALVRQIRGSSLPEAQTMRIVALSANGEKNEKNYIDAGFTAYLNKPFSPQQFFGLLEKLTGLPFSRPIPETTIDQDDNTLPESGYTLKNIRTFTENDSEAAKQIILSFIKDTQQHIVSLQNYLQTKEYKAIFKLAHKMLPMFRQLEAGEVINSLQKLEQAAQTALSEQEIREETKKIIRESRILTEKLNQQIIA